MLSIQCIISQLILLLLLLLLPLALQPAVGFGLSNNTSLFFSIYHQLSPSSHSQHLKISFYFFSPSFPGSSSSSRPFQFLSEDIFGHPILLHFSPGDPANLSFVPLSILLYFLLYSTLLVLDSSYFLDVMRTRILALLTEFEPCTNSSVAYESDKW